MKIGYNPIIFDLDGTLVDSSADIASAVNSTLVRLGLEELECSKIVGFVGDGVRALMIRTLCGTSVDVDQAVKIFKQIYRCNSLVKTRPYAGITELLDAASAADMALVTNKPAEFAQHILNGLDLKRYFQAVVGGDETLLKPNPEPVLLALERLEVDNSCAVMVGDHQNDILAAKRSGLTAVGVTWGFDAGASVAHSGADYLAENPHELATFLGL